MTPCVMTETLLEMEDKKDSSYTFSESQDNVCGGAHSRPWARELLSTPGPNALAKPSLRGKAEGF